jgi:hypothetical protein
MGVEVGAEPDIVVVGPRPSSAALRSSRRRTSSARVDEELLSAPNSSSDDDDKCSSLSAAVGGTRTRTFLLLDTADRGYQHIERALNSRGCGQGAAS